ncbi:MAG: efflux RND transporter periplasmic adaptor subunit [Mobilitalea sp.]
MYNNRKRIIVILLASLLLSACHKQVVTTNTDTLQTTTFKLQEESYTLATAQRGTFSNTFSSKNVQVIYQSDAYVTSDKKTAKLKELLIEERDEVKKGDVLATLDVEISPVDLEEKKMSLARSKNKYIADTAAKQVALDDMVNNLEQMEPGNDKKIYELQIEKTKSQYEQFVYQTEKNIKKQVESIIETEENNADNSIIAPFDGFIVDVARFKPGDKVNQGDMICHMVSNKNLLLGVSENGLLRYNMDVTVTTKFINEETVLKGRVVAAIDVIPEDKWSDMTYIALEDESQYASIINGVVKTDNISIGNVLIVDAKGVTTEVDKNYVSLYEDGQISKRYVVIGKSNSEVVWVLQGLAENQTVITK